MMKVKNLYCTRFGKYKKASKKTIVGHNPPCKDDRSENVVYSSTFKNECIRWMAEDWVTVLM